MQMLILAAAAAAITTLSAERPVARPLVQARATVRILKGATLHLGRPITLDGQRLRLTRVSTPAGVRPARLVEFE